MAPGAKLRAVLVRSGLITLAALWLCATKLLSDIFL
jgi:hypothetical protein